MDHTQYDGGGLLRGRSGLVLLGFLAIAAFFLLSEHRAHLLGFLPWLFVLACPLMHVFMHGGGHGRHGSGQKGRGDDQDRAGPEPHQH